MPEIEVGEENYRSLALLHLAAYRPEDFKFAARIEVLCSVSCTLPAARWRQAANRHCDPSTRVSAAVESAWHT